MKILVTGATGTIGRRLMDIIPTRGHESVAFDRQNIHIEVENDVIDFLNRVKPDVIMHLAKSSITFSSFLIKWAKNNHKQFVFTSSYKVFNGTQVSGPYTVYDAPDGNDEFALGKIAHERLIFDEYPENSYVARLAWQIDHQPGGHNLLSFVEEQLKRTPIFQVSKTLYLPFMFLEDTCHALIDLVESYVPGLYHLNQNDGYSFYDVLDYLKTQKGHDWIQIGDQKKFGKNDLIENLKVKTTMFSELGMIHHAS
jgi:dTDP-4-dehydrorhamnose reductase